MREMIQTGVASEKKAPRAFKSHRENHGYVWPVCGAGIGLIGGVLAPIVGAILTIFYWIEVEGSTASMMHNIATVCFFLTVPLLIFGGCCLDALEKRGWKIG